MKFSGNFFILEIISIFYERKINPHLLLELLIDMSAHYREEWTQEYSFQFESLLETLLEDYHNHCGFPCRSWSHQSLLSLWRESEESALRRDATCVKNIKSSSRNWWRTPITTKGSWWASRS